MCKELFSIKPKKEISLFVKYIILLQIERRNCYFFTHSLVIYCITLFVPDGKVKQQSLYFKKILKSLGTNGHT